MYEIYKAGQDLYWHSGLDLLGPFGWRVAVVDHWNNREAMLPSDVDVLGIDEHTAVALEFALGRARVFGSGGLTWVHAGRVRRFDASALLPLETFGLRRRPALSEDIPAPVQDAVREASEQMAVSTRPQPPRLIHALVSERATARAQADWARADEVRQELASAGWEVRDTPDGPILIHL